VSFITSAFALNKHFEKYGLPENGEPIDPRDIGGRYDFRICTSSRYLFIEVKRVFEEVGGILFTSKE